jgi:hypothetical protein
MIQILCKFENTEDNSIMARELVSDSLLNGSEIYLNSGIEHAMFIDRHKSKEPLKRLITEVNDLTMSSWA